MLQYSPLLLLQQGKDENALLQEEAGKKESLQSGGFCTSLCLVGDQGTAEGINDHGSPFSLTPRATVGPVDTTAGPDRATPEQSDGPAGPPF